MIFRFSWCLYWNFTHEYPHPPPSKYKKTSRSYPIVIDFYAFPPKVFFCLCNSSDITVHMIYSVFMVNFLTHKTEISIFDIFLYIQLACNTRFWTCWKEISQARQLFYWPGPSGLWLNSKTGYCHHFASIVIVSVNFYDYIFFSEITTQLQPNLVGMFIGWISAKFMYSVPIEYSTWLQGPLICLEMLSFSDIVGMFIRSEMILYFMQDHKQKYAFPCQSVWHGWHHCTP